MTIKLMLLKSGEDIITDVSEMCVGTEENKRVIGYYMNKPCIVKMVNPNVVKYTYGCSVGVEQGE